MTLLEWLDANHPGRSGRARLVRAAETSYETVNKALRGEALGDKRAAERISAATGGAVTTAHLLGLEPAAKPARKRRAS